MSVSHAPRKLGTPPVCRSNVEQTGASCRVHVACQVIITGEGVWRIVLDTAVST